MADKEFRNTLGRATVPSEGDYIRLTGYEPNRLEYEADSRKGGVAVFSEIWFPWGWKATIDGKDADIARVNYVLRALKVPAGRHRIEFTFDPESLHVTNGIAISAVVIIYLLLLTSVAFGIVIHIRRSKK